MTKEDELLLATIEDKLAFCLEKYTISHSAFLDPRQSAIAEARFKNEKHLLFGGFEDAERRIMVFLPDYADELSDEDCPLTLLRVSLPKGARPLSHRDYLGALMSLGVDRNISGDIIVRDGGADIIILKSMADFLLLNYNRAGRQPFSCEILPLSHLDMGQIHIEERFETVASLRLDNVLAAAFRLSRGKAQEAIKSGLVFVNNFPLQKPNFELSEGDKLVLRGKGKAVLKSVGKRTRKDRIAIQLERCL